MFTDTYRLRVARPDERDRIREIEDLAGTRFSGLDLVDESLDISFPLEDLARLIVSTFRDVPWNGPFYRTHGFVDLPSTAWTPGMRAIREQAAHHGLRTDVRVFMRRDLDVSTSTA